MPALDGDSYFRRSDSYVTGVVTLIPNLAAILTLVRTYGSGIVIN